MTTNQLDLGLSAPPVTAEPAATEVSAAAADRLAADLTRYNEAYRAGNPLISDEEYDALTETLRALAPEHPFLHAVEVEEFAGKPQFRHPRPMLSTEKAYTREALAKWVDRVRAAAADLGQDDVRFKVTPKLDGLAGSDNGKVLATRGNGLVGSDVTVAFERGLVPVGGRGLGLGEIVICKSYFEENYSDIFEHPRNMVVGIISADVINENSLKALEDGQVRFVPYATLPSWTGSGAELLEKLGEIVEGIRQQVDYALDGMIAEAVDEELKRYMGATSHHYRWQIAIKERGETAQTVVESIVWQTGRTGNVTPVLQIQTVRLSGANISRLTAHHAGLVRDKQIGPGARIEIIRSGEVIPKLEKVLEPAAQVTLPTACPSCGEKLEWRKDFLCCCNQIGCPAQVVSGIRHWFRTLGTADWFGDKTITRLVDGGFDSLEKVYALTEADLLKLGFGAGQTKNLLDALKISRQQGVEDARFLAAFGIPDLGLGDSRKLLKHFKLEDLGSLAADTLAEVKGFGAVTSASITRGLQRRWATISHMLKMGFKLERTKLASEGPAGATDSPISGKKILFTGKMLTGDREEMQENARALGAVLVSSISKQTEILVAGDKASPAKVDKARNLGVEVLTEQEYLQRIGQA